MWGDPKVSIKRFLSNGTVSWNAGGTPTSAPIARAGILESLLMLTEGTITLTAGVSLLRDIWGPWNTYSQISLIPNDGAPLRRHGGYGAYVDMLWRSVEQFNVPPDVTAVGEIGAAAVSDIYAFPTAGSSVDYRFYTKLALTQRINDLQDTFGYFPTDNPQVQLTLNATVCGSTAAPGPFIIDSLGNTAPSATLFPYFGDATSNASLATPTIDVRREVFQTPQNEKDDPNYNYIIQTQEDLPQGANANSATVQQYKFVANSGVLLRMAVAVIDSGAAVAESKLANVNSLEMLYGINEAKFQETGRAAHARMHQLYGFNWPEGVYTWDFLDGAHLTLADTIDLSYLQEVRLNVNLSSALGATGSKVVVWHERLVPVGNVRPGR